MIWGKVPGRYLQPPTRGEKMTSAGARPRPTRTRRPEQEQGPTSGTAATTAVEPTATARVLALQRSAGNRAVRQMLARETATKSGLQRLDELLGKFNVDEDAVIAHLATLSAPEKAIVVRDYRKRIADPLNACEMVRAVRTLPCPLATKLWWVGTAGSPDYGDIRKLITDTVDQKERDALASKEWRAWFVGVCNNATMKQLVVDLRLKLPDQLRFISAEMSTNYDDIKALLQAKTVTDDDRKELKSEGWRTWFVDVCTNATMRDTVIDLKFDAATKVDWMLAEGTDTGLLAPHCAPAGAPMSGAVVKDAKLIGRVQSDLGDEGVRTVDQVYVELCKAEKLADFGGLVDLIPEKRFHALAGCGVMADEGRARARRRALRGAGRADHAGGALRAARPHRGAARAHGAAPGLARRRCA